MRQDEVCFIILEYLQHDTNQMKVLDRTDFHLFQLQDWVTVVDLNMDFRYMKKIL
jgi:hypothetical protein